MQFLGAPASANPFEGVWSQHHFASHLPTQQSSTARVECEVPPELTDPAGVDEELLEDHGEEAEAVEEAARLASAPAQDDGVTSDAPLLMEGDVRGADYGYGVNGASVQEGEIHAKELTDRGIMKKTLLQGTPIIKVSQACDRMRSSRGEGKKALPDTVWKKVVEAGLADCDVAWYDAGKGAVMLNELPTDPTAKIQYHNCLMKLCQLSLRQLIDVMKAGMALRLGCWPCVRISYLGTCFGNARWRIRGNILAPLHRDCGRANILATSRADVAPMKQTFEFDSEWGSMSYR